MNKLQITDIKFQITSTKYQTPNKFKQKSVIRNQKTVEKTEIRKKRKSEM